MEVNNGGERGKIELQVVGKNWGRRPLIRGSKRSHWRGKGEAAPLPGLGPALARPGSAGTRSGRPEPGLGWPNCRKTSNTKTNIF